MYEHTSVATNDINSLSTQLRSRDGAELLEYPLLQRAHIGTRSIFVSQDQKVALARLQLHIEQLHQRTLQETLVRERRRDERNAHAVLGRLRGCEHGVEAHQLLRVQLDAQRLRPSLPAVASSLVRDQGVIVEVLDGVDGI